MMPMAAASPPQTPWLSVLVPVHGVERWLPACLHSLLGQRLEGVEILLLDDASPDASGAQARAAAEAHPEHVRCLRHERNRGLSAARNTMLDAARGQYVWFLDSDDLMAPDAIAQLRAIVDAHAPDLIACDFAVVRERQKLKHRLRGERHRRTFQGPSNVLITDRTRIICGVLGPRQLHAWSKIARRHCWQAARFPEGRCFEDMAVAGTLLTTVGSLWHAPHAWVGYRQREGSILATMSAAKSADLLHAVRDLHAALLPLARRDTRIAQALDTFSLRTLQSIAAKKTCSQEDAAQLDEQGRATLHAVLGRRTEEVLARWRRRGWWLRALRSHRRLKRAGWLQP